MDGGVGDHGDVRGGTGHGRGGVDSGVHFAAGCHHAHGAREGVLCAVHVLGVHPDAEGNGGNVVIIRGGLHIHGAHVVHGASRDGLGHVVRPKHGDRHRLRGRLGSDSAQADDPDALLVHLDFLFRIILLFLRVHGQRVVAQGALVLFVSAPDAGADRVVPVLLAVGVVLFVVQADQESRIALLRSASLRDIFHIAAHGHGLDIDVAVLDVQRAHAAGAHVAVQLSEGRADTDARQAAIGQGAADDVRLRPLDGLYVHTRRGNFRVRADPGNHGIAGLLVIHGVPQLPGFLDILVFAVIDGCVLAVAHVLVPVMHVAAVVLRVSFLAAQLGVPLRGALPLFVELIAHDAAGRVEAVSGADLHLMGVFSAAPQIVGQTAPGYIAFLVRLLLQLAGKILIPGPAQAAVHL